jgi:diguanylate cyclase (GGDEF)-like protein
MTKSAQMLRFPKGLRAETILATLLEALDQVDIGILLLDCDLRVRFFNRRQAEILDLPPAMLSTGSAFRAVLHHSLARSRLVVPNANVDEYVDLLAAAVRAGKVPPTHLDLADGSRLLFTCKTCSDGGRILTYADVSREVRPELLDAMEQINAELRFNNETMEDHAAHLASLAEATDEGIRKVEEAKQELEREITERRQLEAQLRRLATTDVLTGALNRAGFMTLAQAELERDQRPARGLALMMLDVDHFKLINDRYGHAGGDLALKHLVTLLGGRTRRGDLLGRLGGEEFAILLPDIAFEEAERMAERLVSHVAESPVMYDTSPIALTVSIGLTVVTPAERSIEQILARADDALYRAKKTGRNRVVTADRAEAA